MAAVPSTTRSALFAPFAPEALTATLLMLGSTKRYFATAATAKPLEATSGNIPTECYTFK